MILFPNKIDRKFQKKYPTELPEFFYKRKYVAFFKSKGLIDDLCNLYYQSDMPEYKLENFVKYYSQKDELPDFYNLNLFDETFMSLLNRGLSLEACVRVRNLENLMKYIDIVTENLSLSFIEKNNSEIEAFFIKPNLNFICDENIPQNQKEFLIKKFGATLEILLLIFSPDFLYEYSEYINRLEKYSSESFFQKMIEKFNSTEDKNKFLDDIEVLKGKFIRKSTEPFINAYLNNQQCLSVLESFPKMSDLDVDTIKSLFDKKDNPINCEIINEIVKSYGIKYFVEEILCVPLTKVLSVLEKANQIDQASLREKYGNLINIFEQISNSSTVGNETELLNVLLNCSIDYQKFLNDLYDCTVIKDFRENILDINDKGQTDKYPHSKITYKGKEIEIITIDDYPFTLLVSGIGPKLSTADVGTRNIAAQIANTPELWMDMNVKGNNQISMSRISEDKFYSWPGIIAGFSNIRKNQIVSHATGDNNTSMDIEDPNMTEIISKTVLDISRFHKKDCPSFLRVGNTYEEIRANRYLKNENGNLEKYAPDYIVEKGNQISTQTLEWASLYGNKIVCFDYKKISYKAQREFMEYLCQLQQGIVEFNQESQEHLNYLNYILSFFAELEKQEKIHQCYYDFLKEMIMNTDYDMSFVFEMNSQDEVIQQLYKLWVQKNGNNYSSVDFASEGKNHL